MIPDHGCWLGEVSTRREAAIFCLFSSTLLRDYAIPPTKENKMISPPFNISFVVMLEKTLIVGCVLWYCLPYWSLLSLILTTCWFVFYKICKVEIVCVQNPAEYSFDLWPTLVIKLIKNNIKVLEHFFVQSCPHCQLLHIFPVSKEFCHSTGAQIAFLCSFWLLTSVNHVER